MTSDIVRRLQERRDHLQKGPAIQKAMEDQMHLDEGLPRDYWHYGYAVALSDVLRWLGAESGYEQ